MDQTQQNTHKYRIIAKAKELGAGSARWTGRQAKFHSKRLFWDDVENKLPAATKDMVAVQFVWSGLNGMKLGFPALAGWAKSLLTGAESNALTYTQIAANIKENFFLDDLGYWLGKDTKGEYLTNADGATLLFGVMIPTAVRGMHAGASAKVNAGKSSPDEKAGIKNWAKAIGHTALEKVPRYLGGAYAATVAFKTDVTNIAYIGLDRNSAQAQQAIAALQDSFYAPLMFVSMSAYLVYKGAMMFVAKNGEAQK